MFSRPARIVRRSNVTVDDRRAVIVLARARKPQEVAEVPQEQFIRNALKDCLGWPRREPAPKAVLDAAKQMAIGLRPKLEGTAAERARKVGEAAFAALKAREAVAA